MAGLKHISNEGILALPMQENDADASTIREYLKALLVKLYQEGEGFSGKRPFGNSGWDWDIYIPLIKAGVVKGTLDADGWIDDVDADAALLVIIGAIGAL